MGQKTFRQHASPSSPPTTTQTKASKTVLLSGGPRHIAAPLVLGEGLGVVCARCLTPAQRRPCILAMSEPSTPRRPFFGRRPTFKCLTSHQANDHGSGSWLSSGAPLISLRAAALTMTACLHHIRRRFVHHATPLLSR